MFLSKHECVYIFVVFEPFYICISAFFQPLFVFYVSLIVSSQTFLSIYAPHVNFPFNIMFHVFFWTNMFHVIFGCVYVSACLYLYSIYVFLNSLLWDWPWCCFVSFQLKSNVMALNCIMLYFKGVICHV